MVMLGRAAADPTVTSPTAWVDSFNLSCQMVPRGCELQTAAVSDWERLAKNEVLLIPAAPWVQPNII